jgi:amino acid permease
MLVGLTYSLFQSQKSKEATSTTKLVTEWRNVISEHPVFIFSSQCIGLMFPVFWS